MPKPTADSFPGQKELTQLFKTLADTHRLQILYLLEQHGEMTVSDLSLKLGQAQPAVSHHLLQLKGAGLVEYRRDGKFNRYSLATDSLHRFFEVLSPSGQSIKLVLGGVEISVKARH